MERKRFSGTVHSEIDVHRLTEQRKEMGPKTQNHFDDITFKLLANHPIPSHFLPYRK